MSLAWNSRIIANAHLTHVHGFKVAGRYLTKHCSELIALLDLTKQGLSAVIAMLRAGKK